MNTRGIKELEKQIDELQKQLEEEKSKQGIISKDSDHGLWEYDIANKKLIMTQKLDGRWSDQGLVVENYREQIKAWKRIFPGDMAIFDAYCDSMDRGEPHILYEFRAMRDDSRFSWLRYEGHTEYDEQGNPVKVVGKTEDITDERQHEGSAANINKELFDFAFDVISRGDKFYDAVQTIFHEVGMYLTLDRCVLMEYDKGSGKGMVTAKWAREDDGDDVAVIGKTIVKNWPAMEKRYRQQNYRIFEMQGQEKEAYSERLAPMKYLPVSAVQLGVMEGSRLAGAITFENWSPREWNEVEIATLSSITKMLSSYLIQFQTKQELTREYTISKKAMDIQNLVYCVVEEKSFLIKYLSHYARELFPSAKNGQTCYKVMYGKDSPCKECPMLEYEFSKDHPRNVVEYYDETEDAWYTMTAELMGNVEGHRQFLVCRSDVTAFMERVKGEDHLTGAMSYEKFRMEMLRTLRRNQDVYDLVFAGIQDFSRINDDYGYEVGDQVLKAYADKIRKGLKKEEMLCRIKGDDFAALVKQKPSEEIRKIIQSHSDYLTNKFRKRFPNISINCFAGIYAIPHEGEHISRSLDRAMKARRVALQNFYETRGVYTYTKEFERREREQEIMNRTMKDSLKRGYFKVFFQPKVNILTGEIIGAEALVRLVDKNNNLIPPGKFIPLAEKNGMIVEIDRFVYEKTFNLMSKWLKEGKKVPLISVNLSRLHLRDDSLPRTMKQLSDKYGLKPGQIELEITESVFFDDTARLIDMIKQLKDIGYVISMDDFGAGFSTLSLMKTLPVDIIKLDGGFFMNNDMDIKNRAVIASIMQLASNMEFETVSEGVETKEQVDVIKELGGKCVQGFYFYKPMPEEEFEELLKPSEN